MTKEKPFWKTPAYWKDIKRQDKFIKKLNRAIDKKHWKEVERLTKPENKKIRKSDWL